MEPPDPNSKCFNRQKNVVVWEHKWLRLLPKEYSITANDISSWSSVYKKVHEFSFFVLKHDVYHKNKILIWEKHGDDEGHDW